MTRWNGKTGPAIGLAVGLALAAARPVTAALPAGNLRDDGARQAATQLLEGLPLLFVPEQAAGQGAGYVVRGSEASLWLSERGLTYRLHPAGRGEAGSVAGSWAVALDLVGATPRQPVGEEPLQTRVSYFKGPKAEWRTGLSTYSSVVYREPWPGVDLVVSGAGGQLESSFVIRPGADPSLIRLAYRGASAVRLTAEGGLKVETPLGDIDELAPVAYQELDGRRVAVAAAFELDEGDESGRQAFRFRLGAYDPARELVVDPVTLVYCGYIGGYGNDWGTDIAVDAFGSAYVTGITRSFEATFPVTVGPDLTYNGGDRDAFVAKVRPDGTGLDYCGYIGGSSSDRANGIAADEAGNAYLVGYTDSTEATFPVTVGPDLTKAIGGTDVFVAKLRPDGTGLEYCGYIGGTGEDYGFDIAVDAAGKAYVTGLTWWTNIEPFPVTVGPDLTFNGNWYDAFVACINAAGTGLDYCGYIGGADLDRGYGIAVDATGSAYVAGNTASTEATFPVTVGPDLTYNGGKFDAFVAKIRPDGSGLDYCGYIGGSGWDKGRSIAVDAAGNAYVAGETDSTEASFPVAFGPDLTQNGYDDAFVAKVRPDGSGLDYCGYIGGAGTEGNSNETDLHIAVDPAGNAYVIGYTTSTEATFPVAVGPDLTYNGEGDAFIAKVRPDGSGLDYCGYIGGSSPDEGNGIAVDIAGNAYVTGETDSTEASFPVTVGPDLTHNGYSGINDAFVTKVSAFEPDIFADGFESGDTSAWSFTQP